MKLSKLDDIRKDYTRSLSNLNRQIVFAGIAIIWIFKKDNSGVLILPQEFIFPLILFMMSLCLDILQYIYSSVMWTRELRIKEKKYSGDEDFRVPKYLSNISYFVFFYPKVIATIIAYVLLIIRLSNMLIDK